MTVKKKIGMVMLVVVVLAAVCASAFIGARLGVSALDPLTRILFDILDKEFIETVVYTGTVYFIIELTDM